MSSVSPARSKSGTPSVKLLITAGALAATLGGWAAFATTPTPQNQVAAANPPTKWELNLPSLPTLVSPFGQSQSAAVPNASGQTTVGRRSVQVPSPVTVTRSSR
jgi:hypothetical protein